MFAKNADINGNHNNFKSSENTFFFYMSNFLQNHSIDNIIFIVLSIEWFLLYICRKYVLSTNIYHAMI